MSAGPVDVLAVLTDDADCAWARRKVTECMNDAEAAAARSELAIAAVAELLKVANSARIVLEARKTMTESDIRAQIVDLRAAIEYCGGVK